ncbi:hypothetical protein Tco_0681808 [Tanacetum coccineum]|uniref:Uncharacterized protein n=1 Tax=Tanacetum coccineum TaxID=301880 RepID=A0ABQ4XPM7_9ASTR
MTTLEENVIVARADNRLLMLDKIGGVTRTKTYEELFDQEKLQDDCDVRATNIVLQGLQPDQEHECKLYNKFDRFTSVNDEALHEYYLGLLSSSMLAKNMHMSNYDQLYAYLNPHEAHANEVRLMRERFPDLLALIANYHHTPSYQNTHQAEYNLTYYPQQMSPVVQ